MKLPIDRVAADVCRTMESWVIATSKDAGNNLAIRQSLTSIIEFTRIDFFDKRHGHRWKRWDGKSLHDIELRQQAGDNVLFVINPGPCRTISDSSIWNVPEEQLHQSGKASDYHRVGDCEIYFFSA
jgi:hypothetical protein